MYPEITKNLQFLFIETHQNSHVDAEEAVRNVLVPEMKEQNERDSNCAQALNVLSDLDVHLA